MSELIPKVLRIRRRPHAILLCLAVLVAIGSALSCTEKSAPEATVKMQSSSASGKYRCVVTEQLPPTGYYSPHVYTFTIRDALTNRDLKGESYRHDTDSVSLTDLKFVWVDDELTVSLPLNHRDRFSQLNSITVNSNGLRLEIELTRLRYC